MERRPFLDPEGRAVPHNGFVDDPNKQCYGKKKYLTKAHAKRSLSRLPRSAMVKNRSSLKPYRCPHCGYFHLGTKVPTGLLELPEASVGTAETTP